MISPCTFSFRYNDLFLAGGVPQGEDGHRRSGVHPSAEGDGHRRVLSRCEAATPLGRFRCDSDKIQICSANLGFLPSLHSKLPRCPLLRASGRYFLPVQKVGKDTLRGTAAGSASARCAGLAHRRPSPREPPVYGGPIYGGRVCDPSGARGLRMRFSIGAAQPLPLLQHLSWMQDTSRAWVGGVLQRGCLAPALGGPTHFLYSGVSTKRLRCKTPPPRRRWWASALLSSVPTGGSPIGLPASRPHTPEGSALAFRKLVPCKNGDS